tara:strand:+ start:30185 stop:30619 length:435 start_codon:yes stop_codon:yes gene_type:complete
MRAVRCLLIAMMCCALVCSGGCLSLSSTALNGSDLRYPVSMSKSVVDAAGQIHAPKASARVARFKRDWSHWGWLYGSVSLSSHVDLSAMLNEEIEKAGGDGIVNLKVTAAGSGLSWFISLLIIIPERVDVTVEGDVYKLSDAKP